MYQLISKPTPRTRQTVHLRRALWLCCLLAACLTLPVGAEDVKVPQPVVTGLWTGQVMYAPAMVEIDVTVEIGVAANGDLVGTIDIPSQQMKFHPLSTIEQSGTALKLQFDRFPDREDLQAIFSFEGAVENNDEGYGGTIGGTFSGVTEQGPVEAPFELSWVGEPGTERPEPVYSELYDMAQDMGDLKEKFNQGKGKVRILNLLSSTCGVCRISSTLMQRYLLDAENSEQLAVMTVWGPMLGDETRESAVDATSTMPDSRATHYWTEEALIAEQFSPLVGLKEGYLAWDTFMVFDAETHWGDELPTPTLVFHVNQPLPDETRLHGKRLLSEVQKLLPEG